MDIISNCPIFPSEPKKDLDKARNHADEKGVKNVIDVIKSMVNPFKNNHEILVHISSGAVASPAIEDEMNKNARERKGCICQFLGDSHYWRRTKHIFHQQENKSANIFIFGKEGDE